MCTCVFGSEYLSMCIQCARIHTHALTLNIKHKCMYARRKHARTHSHMHMHTHTHTHSHIYTWTHAQIHTNTHARTCMSFFMYLFMYIYACVRLYQCICVRMFFVVVCLSVCLSYYVLVYSYVNIRNHTEMMLVSFVKKTNILQVMQN